MKKLNGLDLFSGIGGITIALEDWVKPVAYCEIDSYSQSVILSRQSTGQLPIAPIWDDITTLSGKMLPRIDLIAAGFPCQDISDTGLKTGLEGKRSGLFFEVLRLVDETRPSFIFLENVASIIDRSQLATVSYEIASRGYDCRWTLLSAEQCGAAHRRNRWWMLAFKNVAHSDCESDLETRHLPKGRLEEQQRNDTGGCSLDHFKRSWWASEPTICRVVNGLPNGLDRLRGLGNSVVPKCAKDAFEVLAGIKAPETDRRGILDI